MDEMHYIELSTNEVEFLKQLVLEDKKLAHLVESRTALGQRRVTIGLTPAEAERFRGMMTAKLAEIGFDSEYSVNAEGERLEDLIDKLFLP